MFNSYLHCCLMLCSHTVPGDWCLDIGRRCCWVESLDPSTIISMHQSTRLRTCTRARPIYFKKGCAHVSARYSGTVLRHEVWSQPNASIWEPYYDCTYKKQWTITSIRSLKHLSQSEISAQRSLQIHRRRIHSDHHNISQMSGFCRWWSPNSHS